MTPQAFLYLTRRIMSSSKCPTGVQLLGGLRSVDQLQPARRSTWQWVADYKLFDTRPVPEAAPGILWIAGTLLGMLVSRFQSRN
jgi:hypothetical protein